MSRSPSLLHPTLRVLLVTAFALAALTTSIQVAHADEHDEWELHVNPYPDRLGGSCGATLEASGWLFPPETEVAVGLISDDGSFTELARIVTTQNGFLLFDLPSPYPPDCVLGTVLTFAARVPTAAGFLRDASGPYQAISTLETRPEPSAYLLVSADPPDACTSVTVSGYGFPPEATIMLMVGGADPFAHEFAEFARATTDENGWFTLTSDYFRFFRCLNGDQIGINASLWSPPKGFDPTFPGASAIYTVGTPDPATAGNAGLLRESPPSRSLQLLMLAVTASLVTVARVTLRGPHQ